MVAALVVVLVFWGIRFLVLRIGSRRTTTVVRSIDATIATTAKEVDIFKKELRFQTLLMMPRILLFWFVAFAISGLCTGLTALVWLFAAGHPLDVAVLLIAFFGLGCISALMIGLYRNWRQIRTLIARARTWQPGAE